MRRLLLCLIALATLGHAETFVKEYENKRVLVIDVATASNAYTKAQADSLLATKANTDLSNLTEDAAANAGLVSVNSTTNTFYNGTNAVVRFITLTNGLLIQVNSATGWVNQVEWTED